MYFIIYRSSSLCLEIASLVAFFTITSAQESSDEYISKVLSQRTLILTFQHKC